LRANVALAGETASFAALAVRGAGPALVLTAHTGAWEVAGSSLASQLSTTLRFVVRGEADARVRELHERIRQQRAVATAYVGDSPEAGLRLLDAIRRGEWLAFQIDRAAPSGRSLLTTLFGREFPVPEGPFRIAKLTGAPILPVFNARTGFMRYTVQAYSPRYLPANSDREALTAAAQYAVDCLQDFVHQHPRQWFHFAAIPDASD
jgi:KDO2-lipid IV(A) lauroyltransferase